MDEQGPYRRSALERCPSCATPLVPADVGARACPAGCGEWYPAGFVDEHWADAVDLDGDPRLRWHVARLQLGCLACAEPMRRVVHRDWSAFRCRDHGVWFLRDGRVRFEAQLAAEIALHLERRRARLARIAELRARLEREPRALEAVFRELEALEQTVASLRAELAELQRWR